MLFTTEAIVIEELFPFAIVIICQEYDFVKQINRVVLFHGQ